MLDGLKKAYLRCHHKWVRQGSDHPIQHAHRMLGEVGRHKQDGYLLDLGSGFEAFFLKDLWKGKRIAVDLVPGPGLDLVADGHQLPLRDGTTFLVLMMETLEHVPAPGRVLEECSRVLRGGGYVCLTAPQYSITHNHPADYFRFTQEGLRLLCRKAGLHILDIRATGGPLLVVFHAIERNLPPKTRLIFVALTHRVFDLLDGWFCGHGNREGVRDALGWAVLAIKKEASCEGPL